jgi:hypothetical protein
VPPVRSTGDIAQRPPPDVLPLVGMGRALARLQVALEETRFRFKVEVACRARVRRRAVGGNCDEVDRLSHALASHGRREGVPPFASVLLCGVICTEQYGGSLP